MAIYSSQKLRKDNALSEITSDATLKALALANLGIAGTGANLDGSFALENTADHTKKIKFDASGVTASKTATIAAVNPLDATFTLPPNTDTLMGRQNAIRGYTTTATAAGTTTLTVASTVQQYFTGATTQTVVLPVTSTLVLGQSFVVFNSSTGDVTVQSSGANSISTIKAGAQATFTCILLTGTTAASWSSSYVTNTQTSLNNYSVAAQTPAATTRTYITGSQIAVPVGKLRIGTLLRWRFNMTKTAAGTATSTFDVAIGTAGTTSDTAVLSFTKPAGTAAADEGYVEVDVQIRGPLSASCIATGEFVMFHNLAATGHAVIPTVVVNTVSSAFDATTANLFVGVCVTSGASDAITIQQMAATATNL